MKQSSQAVAGPLERRVRAPDPDRAALIARAVDQRAKIQQIFDDAAHWNRRNVPWKGKQIDPDPDGQLRRIADGIDRMLASEAGKSVDWRDLKTEPALLGLLRDQAGRIMTPNEAFEQRVSFVFSTQDGMTKDQVREALRSNV